MKLPYSLDDIYWRLKFGKSSNKISLLNLRYREAGNIPPPIFFLSTGRCGTKWFSTLFEKLNNFMVLHQPVPNMAVQSKIVYNIYQQTDWNPTTTERNLINELIWLGREQYFRYSFKTDKAIIETNNSITFFAPVLAEIFPQAKFVHLYRHPGDFVRSGIRRGWYNEDQSIGIKLLENENSNDWQKVNQLEKIAWLWNETNSFIERFKGSLSENRLYSFDFNQLNDESVKNITEFLNIKIPDHIIHKALLTKENVQIKGAFPQFSDWSEEQKQQLKNYCASLSKQYGYTL